MAKVDVNQWLGWLRRFDLRTRMIGVLVLVVIGCGALGFAYWMSLDGLRVAEARRAVTDATAGAVNDFRIGLLAQHRYEQEFLLHHLSRDVERNHMGAKRSRDGLARLRRVVSDSRGKAIVADLQRHFEDYQQAFKVLVEAQTAVGLNEKSGALGRLREAVHGVEAMLKDHANLRLSNIMLMMRRHEKDFLARGKPKYVARLISQGELFSVVLANTDFSASIKAAITSGMDAYQHEFAALVKEAGRKDAAIESAKNAALAIESDVKTAATWIEGRRLAVRAWQQTRHTEINRFFAIVLVVFAILLVVVLVFMARGILTLLGADPAVLAGAVQRIADGDLERATGVPANGAGGVMAAIEAMRARLRQVIGHDVRELVDAARDGDLGRRIELSGLSGFYATLGGGVNELVAVSGAVVADSSRVFAAMARGDLGVRIDHDYRGDFAQLRDDANATVDRLQVVIEHDVRGLADAAAGGDFSQRIDTSSYEGFFRELAEQLNALMDTSDHGLNDVVRVLQALARGDLTERVEAEYQGLFDELKKNTNATIDKLREVVEQIGGSAAEVSRGAAEISEGNASLSSRTEQQASNLEETAAAMEEMTSTVKQNADNARQANQLADGARTEAERGGEVAEQAVKAVSEISAASKKIADIIGVIDEIAFQTNLLALNASVEAARAGEQGRGFAVVASEVRNLAGRSATAAKEIKELIQDSVTKVDEGQKLVEESGQVLGAIVGSVKKVSDIVSEIAAASSEQTEGIGQINQAVTQIDEMTQRNAALVEEAAAASQTVGQQAHRLDGLVGYFKVGDRAGTPRAETTTVAVERRGAERPWGNNDHQSQPEQAPRAAAAAGGDWEEF